MRMRSKKVCFKNETQREYLIRKYLRIECMRFHFNLPDICLSISLPISFQRYG